MEQAKEMELLRELEEYKQERERVKQMIGKIGGQAYSKIDVIMNILFLAIIALLFFLEIAYKMMPANIALEIGVLLVSIKIVWMIHAQHKMNHFQFWILNTIEFRLNEISKKIQSIENKIFQNTTPR